MSTVQNNKIKKNNTLGIKPKKKAIPININTNPVPGKFLFSNQVNNIASSYLSMGRRIQINKNNKTSKIIQVNTNSATNYYTLNSKDSHQTNGSITNSLFTNCKNNNMSDIHTLNVNNTYFNVVTNNNHSQYQNFEINNKIKSINSKDKKHLSTLSNSHISNDKFINGYQNSSNINNSKLKNKNTNNPNSINNLSNIRKTYSTRPNFLDSRIKTKKVPMKSKIRQFKFQYKNNKSISTSFNNNLYSTKRRLKGSYQRDIYNHMRGELLNNLSNEKNLECNGEKNTHCDFVRKNKTLYEIKNKHFRNNTVNFGNKEIMNIFHKKTLSNINTNINNLISINNVNNYTKLSINKNIYINNENNNRNSNINQKRNSISKNYFNNEENPFSHNLINKINNSYNSRKNRKKLSKGKIDDIKICIHDKKLNLKENKYNSNNSSNIVNHNNNYIIFNKSISNNINHNTSNNSNLVHHHVKHPISNNINISGIKKILIRKESKKLNPNQNKINNKIIPTSTQKIKSNIIPSQRNIKINLAKFLQNTKTKQNNKLIVGRKTLSIKKIPKENKSDFSISQINGKISNKILKHKNEGNHINNDKKNINQEKVKSKENVENKKIIENEFKKIDNNKGIDANFISNNNNNKELDNKSENIPEDLVNDIYHYNLKNNKNNKNNNIINCNSNNSTNNNINYGNIKNDYSIDNVSEPINKITHKKETPQNDVIQNIIDLNNSNINNNFKEKENKINKNIKNNNKEENNENINIDNKKQNAYTIEDIKKNKNDNNNKIKILDKDENNEILNNNYIKNNLFDEENLEDLPEDYDENFNDLYSIINRINFGSVLVCVEGFFTPEGKAYKRYKEKFDKFYDKTFSKKGYSFSNSNNKPKKIIEVAGLPSNTKTNSSSSKKKIASPNVMYNDLNIVKELNVNC